MPGTLLGTGETACTTDRIAALKELSYEWRKTDDKQANKLLILQSDKCYKESGFSEEVTFELRSEKLPSCNT